MKLLLLITGSITGRLIRRRRSPAMFLLAASPTLLIVLIGLGRSNDLIAEVYHDVTATLGIAILYPVVALAISTAALGEEKKAHTLPFLLLKPVSRWVIALGALTAAAISSFLILEAGVVATWIAVGVMTGEWSIGLSTTVAVAVQSVASAALFVPLGLILNRATLVGLGYLFLWEGILGGLISGIQASSVYRIVLSAWADLAALSPDSYDAVAFALGRVVIGAGGAISKVLVMALVSVVITGTVLRNRDLVGE